MTSSITNFGTEVQSNTGSARSPFLTSAVLQSKVQGEDAKTPALIAHPIDETPLAPDRSVAELSIRRLTREIEFAKDELKQLETTLVTDLLSPTVREWLLPLMAIGLALSLYGSFSASNSAELGATGLMLLWSLSAFWFVYTSDKRLEMAKRANKAEIEIWSGRIDELQQSIEQNQRVIEVPGE